MLRLPLIWVHGRFQDEEGTIFFAYGWHFPHEALWRPFAGYLNLGANAVTLAAASLVRGGIVPLAAAPYLTMITALAVQTVPALLLATGRAPWLADRRYRIAALLLVAIPPLTEEVWVNTLHIQFHLALAAAIVLALDVPRRRWMRAVYCAPLLIAPLCGPGAIVLLPLFLLRAGIERDGRRLVQATALGAASAAQMLLFFTPSPIRPHHLDPATLAAVLFGRLMLLPLVTRPVATPLVRAVAASWRDGTPLWWGAAVASVAYAGWLLATAARGRRDGAAWLIAAAWLIGAISFGFGMIVSAPAEWFSIGAAERYDFLPLVLLGLGLLALAARPMPKRRVFVALVCLTLLSGLVGLFGPLHEFRRGPSWPAEVAIWQRDHDHRLASWPADWTVDLSDRARPCPPATSAPSARDPSYCETAWRARVLAAFEASRR